ncbi:right-handed parallel beta-helix repeat-containing protein [Occultella gossypii]|uniref:Right-handed parallel beta-helix repeat-containing protein n=1 Tax=Occultella gossypii TaxID=2800820 RepID=A0ABS7SBW5_9MICO|nr:right-handed parallel beta-helix repeat-containing protein [Occultella gossypii]MBZ2196748.1 right-handed parallel beta-helix repeat-containing protein [Occultella gossypii]
MSSAGGIRRWRAVVSAAAIVTVLVAGCGSSPSSEPTAEPNDLVHVPGDAATISAAMDLVAPGGLVLVEPGTYAEEVTVDVEDVTLRGTDRNTVVIDGGGTRSFGVFASADGVRIENLTVHSTLFYGVLVTGLHDENGPLAHGGPGYTELDPSRFPPVQRFAIDHVTSYNNGLYGIYAFNAQHGTITNSYASGSADSGFYVGQCEQCDILVAGNVAERNAIGFENANASDSVTIAGNRFSHNRIGMTLISNYQEAFTPQRDNLVVGNLVSDNTSADSPAHALGGFGVGLAINGGQGNRVVANRIEGNPVVGVQLSNAEDLPAVGNQILDNIVGANGFDLADTSAARAPSSGNCFDGTAATTALPASLLRVTCPGGNAGEIADGGAWPRVDVPVGMSFLQVPAPPAQPSLQPGAAVEEIPGPLPAQVTMPAEADFPVPEASLLADRSGVA